MKTLGLIGGMSWESTAKYYQLLNAGVKEMRGGLHSAPLIIYSVDFDLIAQLQHQNNWQALSDNLVDIAHKLQRAGADAIMICTNTMHKVAPQIIENTDIPVLHIADAVVSACRLQGITKVGLLGTQFTMEQPFLRDHIAKNNIAVIVPNLSQRQLVHHVIYQELCQGIVTDESKIAYQGVIKDLQQRGAQAVILGCTEIGLLITENDSALPVLDTTVLHASAGIEFILSQDE